MLVIHWTEQNNISDILANGIKPASRLRGGKKVRGIWCYPYTRNKVLNNTWKRQLKSWSSRHSNFNGIVFRLDDIDFPFLAGPFWLTNHSEEALVNSTNQLQNSLKYFPSTIDLALELELDITDYEIILQKHIAPNRIIKIIKDRQPYSKSN